VGGSAFFIDSRTLLTNFHLVKDAEYILVSPIKGEGQEVEATLKYADPTRDLAILKVDGISGKPLKGSAVKHRVGDKVYVIGNPEGFSGTFSEGVISGFREIDGVDYIQMTAPISHGSSGGPVLDANGAVVGIATAFVENAQNLNLAVELDFYGVILLQMDSARSKPIDPNEFFPLESRAKPPATEKTPIKRIVDKEERATLAGIKTVQVVVETIRPDAELDGLRAVDVKTDVELQLRRSAITIVEIDADGIVYVNVSTMKTTSGLYAYSTSVELQQLVRIERNDHFALASTWLHGKIGTVGASQIRSLRTDIIDEINLFINDYLATNPKK
jgi:hypothetical protein